MSDDKEFDILEKIEWACDTIRKQELFGLDSLGGAKSRERRAKGVLIDCKKEIERLKAKNEKLRKCVEFYANKENWSDDAIEDDDVTVVTVHGGFDPSEVWDSYGGKLARQTLREVESD